MTDPVLLAEAAHWIERTADGDAAALDACAAWLAQSASHGEAFARVSRTQALVGRLADDPALRDVREQTLARVARARRVRAWRPRLRYLAPAAALVAMAPLAAIGLRLWPAHPAGSGQTDMFRTAIGQQAGVTLADGSVVVLDTDSSLQVHTEGVDRRVRLTGQAWFRIAPGAAPLLIEAGDHRLVARAGAFDVRVEPGRVRVYADGTGLALENGSASLPVPAGHLLDVRGGTVLSVPLSRPNLYTGWRSGLVQFENAPVRDVAAELNRYRQHPMRVADARAADLRVSGSFRTAEGPAFPAALAAGFPVRVMAEPGGGLTIASR